MPLLQDSCSMSSEELSPVELEELARIAGANSLPIADNPEDSIPLLLSIAGRKGYKTRLKMAAEELYELLYTANSVALSRRPRQTHLTVLEFLLHSLAHVASIPVTSSGSRQRFVAISRTARDFVEGANYGHISYAAFIKLVDALEAYDPEGTGGSWLEVKPAYHNRKTGKGRRTRIKASPVFCDWMVKHDLIFPWHPQGSTAHHSQCKATKALLWVSSQDNAEETTKAKPLNRQLLDDERVLPSLNITLNKQQVKCRLDTYADYEKLYDFRQGRPKHSLGGNRMLFRQFSLKDGRGGRLYGHWVQSLPAWCRQYLTIDGEPTAELDYSSMQLALLYAIEGVPLPRDEDLYALPCMTSGGPDASAIREDMKLVLTRSVGNPTREKSIVSLKNALRDQNRRTASADKLYDDFWKHHLDVCPHTLSAGEASWPKLQNLESRIALRVLSKLLEEGIAAIPIHDSFIVKERDAARTERAMRDAFAELCPGVSIGIKCTPSHRPF